MFLLLYSLGGYGILPYPLRPLNILKGCSGLRCTNRDSIAIFPQVSWEFGCVGPPTDFTDLHRWFGCICSPTEFTEFTEVWGCCWQRGYGRMPYPPNLCASVPICGRHFSARRFRVFCAFCGNIVSHGFHRSTQMVGCVNSPTEFTDLHGWFGCVGSPTEFTEFTEVWGCCWQRGYGRMPYPPNLCASVPICGRHFSARRFRVFCAFCGNIVSHGFHRSTQMVGCVNSSTEFTEFTEVCGCCWLRGYGRMPYPPTSVLIRAICGRCFSARRFCAFRGFCGRCFSARRFCVFCAFCGRYPCLFCWCSSCSDSR